MTLSQTAQGELQGAIYQALVPAGVLDATLASLGVQGVFDFRGVPQNQAFDYITLGNDTEQRQNTFGRRGYQVAPTIHIWSRQGGTQTATAILSRINQLINQQSLTLATHSLVYLQYERALWVADPDGLTMHVAVKYSSYVEE